MFIRPFLTKITTQIQKVKNSPLFFVRQYWTFLQKDQTKNAIRNKELSLSKNMRRKAMRRIISAEKWMAVKFGLFKFLGEKIGLR